MPSIPEYLTMEVYRNRCTAAEQHIVDMFFLKYFEQPKLNVKEPLNPETIRLWIMLGLFNPRTCDIRCMGRSTKDQRCQNTLSLTNLSNSLQRLWDVALSLELQSNSLLQVIYGVDKYFLCEGQHRREVAGRLVFAEMLAHEWLPYFEEFRSLHNLQQPQQGRAVAWMVDIKPKIGADGFAAYP